MSTILQMSTFAMLTAAFLFPVPEIGQAQNNQASCTAGVAANGECVDLTIGNSAIQSAVILTQPKISSTAYPILPAGDLNYRYPNQLNPNQQPPSSTGTPIPPN
jgi:hypothetical protein